MGVVYEGKDESLGRSVAIKTFNLATAIAPSEQAAFEQRFFTEARIAATIAHPNVVSVHEVGRDEKTGLLFMALEHVKGESLADRLVRGPMPWRDAASLLSRVARALNEAHVLGIVHRDIKPANVMIGTNGEPKVMDFGIAKASTSQLTVAGQVFGTPAYMSPEQASGEEVDGRSDIFSLGAMFYEMVTGYRPFEGPTMAATLTRVLRDEPVLPTSIAPDLPRPVDSITNKALRKARQQRYSSASEFANDLDALLAGKSLPHATELTPLDTVDLTAPNPISTLYDRREAAKRKPSTRAGHSDETVGHLQSDARREPVPSGPVAPTSTTRLAMSALLGTALGGVAVLLATRAPQTGEAGQTSRPLPTASQATIPTPQAPSSAAEGAPGPTPRLSLPVPRPTRTALAIPAGSATRAVRMPFELSHPFASGSLRVWVDSRIVLASTISGLPKKSLGVIPSYEGFFGSNLDVPPGPHEIQVEVRSGSTELRERIKTTIDEQDRRRLVAKVGKVLQLKLE